MVIAMMTFLSVQAQAEPVMTLLTINTNNQEGYIDWARESAAALAAANGATAIGACTPRAGAEYQGDLYFWTFHESQAAAWKSDANSPAVQKEVSKMNVDRKIREWDTYRIVKPGKTMFSKSFAWNVIVSTVDVRGYVNSVQNIEKVMNSKGFEDVEFQVFVADSGRRAGKVMTSMAAASAGRLGAALDIRTEDWFVDELSKLEFVRDYEHAWGLECETFFGAG